MMILALQALHKFSNEKLYSLSAEEYQKITEISQKLIKKKRISWQKIYKTSDIGKERLEIANKIGFKEEDLVLEIGCGRGYSTAAAANFCKKIFALDSMIYRKKWWNMFYDNMEKLGLKNRVIGIKAEGTDIPFKDNYFDIVFTIHAIRNFKNGEEIINTLKEMKRVVKSNGRIIVVENLPVAKNIQQENYLRVYELKKEHFRGEIGFFTEKELIKFFKEAGIEDLKIEIIDLNYDASPPLFDSNSLPEEKKDEYTKIVDNIQKYGIFQPPVVIIQARKSDNPSAL